MHAGLNRLHDAAAGLEQGIATQAGQESAQMLRITRMLKERLESEIAAGKVTPERAQLLRPILEELTAELRKPDGSIRDQMHQAQRVRELMQRLAEVSKKPSLGLPPPPEGSRAARILGDFEDAKADLLKEMLRAGKGEQESRLGQELVMRHGRAHEQLVATGGDSSATVGLEQESLRGLAMDLRQFFARRRPLLVAESPASDGVFVDPNAVFYSGGERFGEMLGEICEERGLALQSAPTSGSFEAARWKQLAQANVAVFDFTEAPGAPLAAVCYEYGAARALGKPSLVLASVDRRIPFDVDVTCIAADGSAGMADAFGAGVDRLLVWPGHAQHDSCLKGAIAAAVALAADSGDSIYVKQTVRLLTEERDDPDAVSVATELKTLIGFFGEQKPMLLYPAWPTPVQLPASPNVFHVMPFGAPWSNDARDAVEAACGRVNARYVRGDRVLEPDIIQSIWDGVCQASLVVADVTGLNPNVAVELGMAHAIGRRTLVVSAKGQGKDKFPMIAHSRIHRYQDLDDLQQAVIRHLGESTVTLPPPPQSTIQRVIAGALEIEEKERHLFNRCLQQPTRHGAPPTEQEAGGWAKFFADYILHVPHLVNKVQVAVRRTTIEAEFGRLHAAAETYWADPHNIIPDHLGLFGVLDDAYLTIRLFDELSKVFFRYIGRGLIPRDMTPANLAVSHLVGPDATRRLEQHISYILGSPNALPPEPNTGQFPPPPPGGAPPPTNWHDQFGSNMGAVALGGLGVVALGALASMYAYGGMGYFAGANMMDPLAAPDPIWGNASIDQIVDTRLGAMGVV